MIVDDIENMRVLYKKIITCLGKYNIAGEATTGQDAVHLYQQLKPDLVLLDIMLPDISGIDVLKQIRSFDENAKIIMISLAVDSSYLADAFDAGALDCIIKPFYIDRLLSAINRALGPDYTQ